MATLYSRLLVSELDENHSSVIDNERNTRDGLNLLYPDIKREHQYEYRDFETINWFRDLTIQSKSENYNNKLYNLFFAAQGWIAVTLIGAITGLVTFALIISITFLNDLREGHCQNNLLLNQRLCNWANKIPLHMIESDSKWIPHQDYFFNIGYSKDKSYYISYFIYVFLSTLFASLSAILTYYIAPYAVNSSIAEIETILKGFVVHNYLGIWTAIMKCVTCVLAVSSGLNVGFECTLVYVGTAVGNIVSRFFSKYRENEAKKRELLTSGAAAGISCPFNAPISGLLFCFEEASKYFSFKILWRTFWCTLVSTLICYHVFSPYYDNIIFEFEIISAFKMFELVPLVIIGIVGGIFGVFIIKLFHLMCWMHKSTLLGRYPILEVFVIALFISIISFNFPLLMVSNSRLIFSMFGDCSHEYSIDSPVCNINSHGSQMNNAKHIGTVDEVINEMKILTFAFFMKFLFLVICFSLKIPNGFLLPIMTIGAVYGRIIGDAMKYFWLKYPSFHCFKKNCLSNDEFHPCIDTSIYALVGSCAFLAGSTHLTVTLVVMMFELTQGSAYAVPLMIVIFIAKVVSKIFSRKNIFEVSCFINEYPYIDMSIMSKSDLGTADDVCSAKKIRSKNQQIVYLTLEPIQISKLYDLLSHPYYSFPILEGHGSSKLIGVVVSHELFKHLNELVENNDDVSLSTEVTFNEPIREIENTKTNFSKIIDYNIITIPKSTPLFQIIQIFDSLGLQSIHVTHHGDFIEIITKMDLIHYINKTV